MERVGVFGGTFDPPHVGHLALAEWARARLDLDRVLFVPAGLPPHKRDARVTSAAARLAMTRLAVRGNPAFEVSTLEVRSRTPSYTVDTLRRLRAERPRARWYLVIGADSLDEFHTWHEPREILKLATLAVAERPAIAPGRTPAGGALRARSAPLPAPPRSSSARSALLAPRASGRPFRAPPAGVLPGAIAGRVVWLGNPVFEVSSTLVRARARAGRSIRYLVPDAVAAYIARHRLYARGR